MSATQWLDPENEADRDLIGSVWVDAPLGEEEGPALALLLGAAQEQCLEYLVEEIAVDAEIPDRWRLALIQQARALWQSSVSDQQDGIGDGGFRVAVFPMDWTVKNLLRPKRGVPVVG